jgi:hypothetical protein
MLGGPVEQMRAIQAFKDDGDRFHSITISNVLNVMTIPEMEEVLDLAARMASDDTDVYLTVYEGDKSGRARKTRDGYQQNKRIQWYEKLVRRSFKSVERHGQLIVSKLNKS